MSVLALHAGQAAVTALVVTAEGTVAGRGQVTLAGPRPAQDRVEQAVEEVWRATLAAARAALGAAAEAGAAAVAALGVASGRDTLVVWDQETLGAARPMLATSDRRAAGLCRRLREAGHEAHPGAMGPRLLWLAEHEPRTWALVEEGRYVVGDVGSYLLARMTRGTWHVTDLASAARTLLLDSEEETWSPPSCRLFGVPEESLPELVRTGGLLAGTDARILLGLHVPVTALVEEGAAALLGASGNDAAALGAALLAGEGAGTPLRRR